VTRSGQRGCQRQVWRRYREQVYCTNNSEQLTETTGTLEERKAHISWPDPDP